MTLRIDDFIIQKLNFTITKTDKNIFEKNNKINGAIDIEFANRNSCLSNFVK